MKLRNAGTWLMGSGLLAALAAGAIVLAVGASGSGAAPPARSAAAPPAAAKPSAAEQRALHRRFAAARRANTRAHSSVAQITAKFAVFRRAAGSADVAPNAQPQDISRKARGAAVQARGTQVLAATQDVYLLIRKDTLCVAASGGVACTDVVGSHAPALGLTAADGSAETLWGAAPDDVTSVKITTSTGEERVIKPDGNIFVADLGGVSRSIEFTHADGRVTEQTG